jgi:hypothetical protein
MEKPGMDRPFPRFRAGLLGALILLGPALSGIGALSGEDEFPAVELRTFPEVPVLNDPWTVLILVDYPDPAGLILLPPPLPPALTLERVFTGGRLIPGPEGKAERWTAAEFSFMVRQSGSFDLGPFEIRAAGKRALTPPLRFSVQDPRDPRDSKDPRDPRDPEDTSRTSAPFFRWETPPLPLSVGEGGEFALLLLPRDPQKPIPEADLVRGKAPGDLILETRPLSAADRERGVVFRFRLIPLRAGDFELGPSLFYREGFPEVPAVRVRVQAAPEKPLPAGLGRNAGDAPGPASGAVQDRDLPSGGGASPAFPGEEASVPFPSGEPPRFPLFRAGYERTRQSARELWEGGNRAGALALLRRGERDLASGRALAALRQDAERVLALEPGEDESRRPLVFLGLLCAGMVILLLFVPAQRFFSSRTSFSGKKDVTSPRVRRYKGILLFPAIIFALALFGLGEGLIRRNGAGGPGPGRRGILRAVAARRVPDPESAVNFRFGEGQSVIVRGASSTWVYVEDPGGRTGWVPEDRLIIY